LEGGRANLGCRKHSDSLLLWLGQCSDGRPCGLALGAPQRPHQQISLKEGGREGGREEGREGSSEGKEGRGESE